jgi:hypothetical protein
MAALDTEKAAVDAAFSTLAGAVSDYLIAGGQAELVGRWLIAHVAGIDGRISKVADRHGNLAINARELRALDFADSHES